MNLLKKPGKIFYGWWIVLASLLLFTLGGGTAYYGLSAFFLPIINETGWSRAETSFAFSLRGFEGGLVQPVVGFLVNRIGARKCIITGVIIMGAAFLLMSRITSISTFYGSVLALTIGNSLGMGIAEHASVANWFRRRRSLAFGILTAGVGLSGIMAPVMVNLIRAYGWRQTLVFLCPVVLAVGLPLSLVIRYRPEPYGYLPDGDKPGNPTTAAPGTHGPARASVAQEEGLTAKECLRNKHLLAALHLQSSHSICFTGHPGA